MKVLTLCLGNICRSPMAEGALRARIQDSPLRQWVEVDSAGTGGWHAGRPPDPRAIACAREHGVDISGLRARQLQAEDFHSFDLILCADADNLRNARDLAPAGLEERAVLMMEWAGPELAAQAPGAEVPDPYYGGPEDFERVWKLVDAAAQAVVDRLLHRAPETA